MRVLQLGPFPPPNGGVAANLTAIRLALLSRGHACQVVALTRPPSGATQEEGVFRPRTARDVVKTIRKLSHDIVHVHIGGDLTWRLLGLALVVTLLPGRKSILSFHSGGYPSSPKGRTGGRLSLRGFVFRRFARIVCVNQEIMAMFGRFGVPADRMRLISPFSFSEPAPDTKIPEAIAGFIQAHKPRLIAVGLLEPEYDLERQIDVMGDILAVHGGAGLVLIGSGTLEKNLRARIESKPYSDRVLLCGDVPRDATLKVISQCDLMLRTTLYDGDAISVREALHVGLPVVATDAAPRPEGVMLVPVGDSDALKAAIFGSLARETRGPRPPSDGQANIRAILELYEELL